VQRYLVQRLLQGAVTLLVISLIVFCLARLTGHPLHALLPEEATKEDFAAAAAHWGLDRPLPVQYLTFLGNALRGDLGVSIRLRQPALDLVIERLPATLSLAGVAILVSLLIAVPIGVLSAVKRDTALDYGGKTIALLGQSMPSFWLGIVLIWIFAVGLGWLPASGFVPPWESPLGNLQRMLMPAIVLGTALAAVLMRQTRNSMIEVMSADYIRTAYSKGLAGRVVVFRHAIRNSLIPVVTILGLQMGALMSGAVVTEQIFVVPGFGRLIVESVFTRDYPLVQGVVLITASSYVLINLLVDVSYSLLDPRIRVKGSAGDA